MPTKLPVRQNHIGQRRLIHRPHYLKAPGQDKCTLVPFPVRKRQRGEVPVIHTVTISATFENGTKATAGHCHLEGQQKNLFRGPNKSHDPVLCWRYISRPLEWCWRTIQKWSNNLHTVSYRQMIPVSYTTRFVYMSKNIGCLIHNWAQHEATTAATHFWPQYSLHLSKFPCKA